MGSVFDQKRIRTCVQLDNKFDWLCFDVQYLWWLVVEWAGQNRETDEEHDEDCVEEGSVD